MLLGNIPFCFICRVKKIEELQEQLSDAKRKLKDYQVLLPFKRGDLIWKQVHTTQLVLTIELDRLTYRLKDVLLTELPDIHISVVMMQ